jgi:hypothetical protein
VILSHPVAAVSLEFCPLTVQSQILPERFECHIVTFPVTFCTHDPFVLAFVAADTEFFGRKLENKDKRVVAPGVGGSIAERIIILDTVSA